MTNLKRILREKGHTTAELSDRSGVNIRMLRYYLSGYRNINNAEAITVYKLATVLKCTVEDLLEK